MELWDLVSAFGRIIRENVAAKPSSIVYDDTPIHVYMERIHARLVENGRLAFGELFEMGMHKSKLVGIFLATLELVRHHRVRLEQNQAFGEIWLLPGRECAEPLDVSNVDEYEHRGGGPGARDQRSEPRNQGKTRRVPDPRSLLSAPWPPIPDPLPRS